MDVADDGEAAWHPLQRDRYDLLITDNDMPRLGGLELIKRIRGADMTLPIIMTSASFAEADALDFAQMKISAVLTKPFAFWNFLNIVSNALRGPVGTFAPASDGFASAPLSRSRTDALAVKPVHNHVLIADDDPTVRGSLAAFWNPKAMWWTRRATALKP